MIPTLTTWLHLTRLNRPVGIYLLLWPCFWGLLIGGRPNAWLFFLFMVGAAVMRSAGCIYNDILDRHFDKKVARTRHRPLAAGIITLQEAIMLLLILLATGFLILMQLPPATQGLGLLSLVLVGTYPLMKRITYWPQAFLGLTFNWGVWMGWSAATVSLDDWLSPFLLYATGFFWTLAYDTIYAYQDREDDLKAMIRSSAIRVGKHAKPFIALMFTGMQLCLMLLGHRQGFGLLYHSILGIIAIHQTWQIVTLTIHDPLNCLERFKANHHLGLLIILALALEQLIT